MDLFFSRFADLLVNGKILYSRMTDLSTEKKSAILAGKIDELDRVVKEEQNQLVRLQEWEKNRKRCCEELALKLSRSPSDINIQDVISAAPEKKQAELSALHKDLLTVVEEQVALNDSNRKLIESRLEYINAMVDGVRGDTDASQVYGSSGAESERKRPDGGGILNLKA